ncbi:DJ-1 family glyoxalase III [Campylobacter sp.]|uniref:DJ-1 family glyoxalase III n=1 Tax=Campylobacter sp. TaxID=205 RepID=UPI0025C0C858|nr:DJ-1 family glyoxalase III [Campylobacter sp.]
MSKKVLVPLAKGFEEAEFIGIVDVLKRAGQLSGNLEIIIASLDDELLVKGANGICIQAETRLAEVKNISLDAIAMAGGLEGMMNLKNNDEIIKIIKELYANKKIVAAICASPIVLAKAGVIKGEFSCYPGCEIGIDGTRISKAVVVNENVITSAGPATAILFGLELVKHLCSIEIYEKLYEGMLVALTK